MLMVGSLKDAFVNGRLAVGRDQRQNRIVVAFLNGREMRGNSLRSLLIVFLFRRALAFDVAFPIPWNTKAVETCNIRDAIDNLDKVNLVCELRLDEQKRTEKEEEEEEEEEEEKLRMDVTDLVNQFLPLVSKLMLACRLDPLPIPDFRRSFSIRLKALPEAYVSLTYSLFSGLLQRLSELEHVDTVIIGTFRDKALPVDASIEMNSLLFSYNYSVETTFLREQGRVRAEATSISANLGVDVAIVDKAHHATGYKLVLREFKLQEIGTIAISVEGADSMVGKSIASLVNFAVSLASQVSIKEIERRVATMLRGYLEDATEDSISPWTVLSRCSFW